MKSDNEKIIFLVVDDSDLIRRLLKDYFKDYNTEVITCHDGLEGIKQSMEYKPDLIFLDLMMPNMDGIKMLQVIKLIDDLKSVPIIVISGNTSRANVLAAHEAGADRIISKPLDRKIIFNTVKELLKKELTFRDGNFSDSFIDEEEMIMEMRRFFVKNFNLQRDAIEKAIAKKDKDFLRVVVHEIKGSGSTIGYPQLTFVSKEIEQKLSLPVIDWDNIKIRLNYLISIADDVKNNLNTKEEF